MKLCVFSVLLITVSGLRTFAQTKPLGGHSCVNPRNSLSGNIGSGVGRRQIAKQIARNRSIHAHAAALTSSALLSANGKVLSLSGGFVAPDALVKLAESATSSPGMYYNSLLIGLAAVSVLWKIAEAKVSTSSSSSHDADGSSNAKPAGMKALQFRFLAVFWLMRMADWLQGPYFYEVFSSKIFNGQPASLDLVSKLFLVGFASTGIFGPWIGRFVDTIGRRAGTIAFAALYSISALSTRSSLLPLLVLGRFAGGLGTSLLFSAPEAWLVGEHQREKYDGKWLGQTFGWAYAGDSLVAITAGQLAALAAGSGGPSGPFTLSVGFLVAGSVLSALTWRENVAATGAPSPAVEPNEEAATAATPAIEAKVETKKKSENPTIGDAISLMVKDKRIILLGAVQALFEGAMYIFVLQWPPAIKAAIAEYAKWGGAAAAVPYGTIFSCFMASCLVGSTLFSTLQSKGKGGVSVEMSTLGMLFAATMAMSCATFIGSSSLAIVSAAFFIFEACVGMYFPSIGTLRSRYLPNSHRSVIMNLFGIPLNLIVISVFLSISSLGTAGALSCASASLGIATLCMAALARSSSSSS